MADQSARSVQELKAETERTRAGLTDTVEQLRASVSETANDVRQRVSPTAIKAEISGYIRNRREQLVEDVVTAARDNPMQAVAVGAAVGYPIFKIARAIPLPILLIGAGLFLTSSKRGKALVHDASDYAADLADETMARAHDLSETVSRTFHSAVGQGMDAANSARDAVTARVGQLGDTLSAAQGAAKDRVGQFGESLSAAETAAKDWAGKKDFTTPGGTSIQGRGHSPSTGSSATDRVADLTDQAGRTLRDATGSLRQTAADAADSATRAASSVFDTGMEAARSARESAMHAASRANRTISSTIQTNPMLVAGLGLVVGALIASSLPRTDVEDSLVGPTRDALKERAKNAAADQYETVKNTATDILNNVAESAKNEGLSPQGMDASAQDVAQKFRKVADAGISTAMKAGGDNTESGGRKNG